MRELINLPAEITENFIKFEFPVNNVVGEYDSEKIALLFVLISMYDHILKRTELPRIDILASLTLKESSYLTKNLRFMDLYSIYELTKFIKQKPFEIEPFVYEEFNLFIDIWEKFRRYKDINEKLINEWVQPFLEEMFSFGNINYSKFKKSLVLFISQLIDLIIVRSFLTFIYIVALVNVAHSRPDSIELNWNVNEYGRFLSSDYYSKVFMHTFLQLFLLYNNIHDIIKKEQVFYNIGKIVHYIKSNFNKFQGVYDTLIRIDRKKSFKSFTDYIYLISEMLKNENIMKSEQLINEVTHLFGLIVYLHRFFKEVVRFLTRTSNENENPIFLDAEELSKIEKRLWQGKTRSDILNMIGDLIFETKIFELGFVPTLTIDNIIHLDIKLDNELNERVDFDYIAFPYKELDKIMVIELKKHVEEHKIMKNFNKFCKKAFLYKAFIEHDLFNSSLSLDKNIEYMFIAPPSVISEIIKRHKQVAIDSKLVKKVIELLHQDSFEVPISLASFINLKPCTLEVTDSKVSLQC